MSDKARSLYYARLRSSKPCCRRFRWCCITGRFLFWRITVPSIATVQQSKKSIGTTTAGTVSNYSSNTAPHHRQC